MFRVEVMLKIIKSTKEYSKYHWYKTNYYVNKNWTFIISMGVTIILTSISSFVLFQQHAARSLLFSHSISQFPISFSYQHLCLRKQALFWEALFWEALFVHQTDKFHISLKFYLKFLKIRSENKDWIKWEL